MYLSEGPTFYKSSDRKLNFTQESKMFAWNFLVFVLLNTKLGWMFMWKYVRKFYKWPPPLQPPGPPSSISRSCSGKCCCLLELRLRFQLVPLGLGVTDMFVCSVLPARMWSSTFDGTPPPHTHPRACSFLLSALFYAAAVHVLHVPAVHSVFLLRVWSHCRVIREKPASPRIFQ